MGKTLAELARRMYPPDRLYPLRSEPTDGWWAGHLPDGRQALVMDAGIDELEVLTFGADGAYLGFERREARLRRPPSPDDGDLNQAELFDHLRSALGFAPGVIRVRRFADPELRVRIEPLADPDDLPSFGDDEASLADRCRMVADGDFEFHAPAAYVVDRTGEVVSS